MRFDRVSNLNLIALLSLLTVFLIGCQRPPLWNADILQMSDPTIARQLLFGFYDVDEGRWRWTGRVFGVALATSTAVRNTSKKTFQIGVDLYFPQPEIDQLGPITLTAIASDA